MKEKCLAIAILAIIIALIYGFFAAVIEKYGWDATCAALINIAIFLSILVIFLVILFLLAIYGINRLLSSGIDEKPDDGSRYGNYVYYDYENEPGSWAHNDTLYLLIIIRTDGQIIDDWVNTDEGWEIKNAIDSEPDGSCGEYIQRTEQRKNGLSFTYKFLWRDRCWWYPSYDVVRMLFDKQFFNKILKDAEQGDAISQTLVGSCYGHNGRMSLNVVEHDIEKANYWWNKAAENGFIPAMVELALYHWHKGEKEKAVEWNKKSGHKVFIINNYMQFSPVDDSDDSEV